MATLYDLEVTLLQKITTITHIEVQAKMAASLRLIL